MDKLKRILPAGALVGLCSLIFFLRLHTYDEPLERDLTTYAVIAHEMLNGKNLYSDLWDHKPPAIHATYAAAEWVAGYGRNSIFLMNVLAAIATMIACYFAGAAQGSGRTGGLVAATLWALASGDLAIQGNQPNTEVFLNAFLTAGFALLVGGNTLGFRRPLIAGVLFAIASLYKQVAVVPAGLIGLACLITSSAQSRKRALAELALIALTGAVTWLLVFGYFVLHGRQGSFLDAVFTYNRWYSGSIRRNLGYATSWPNMSMQALAPLILMGSLSVLGVVAGLIFGPRRKWIMLVSFGLGTDAAVLLPGHFFAHYYQLWLPVFAIGAGWMAAHLVNGVPARWSPFSYGMAGTICILVLALELPYYRLSPATWSARKYGKEFVETDLLGYQLNNLLEPSETFYEWGNESGLYFTSQRRPASGIVFVTPALVGPLASQLSQRLARDLEHSPPELVVVNEAMLPRAQWKYPLLIWFNENYRPILRVKTFLLLARKGGRLDTRQADASKITADRWTVLISDPAD